MKEVNLPDFEELVELSTKIGDTERKLIESKDRLDEIKSAITLHVINNSEFWTGNKIKPPSMEFIKNTYHIQGFDDNTGTLLVRTRQQVADYTGTLSRLKRTFDIYRDQISVWQTQEANKRASLF